MKIRTDFVTNSSSSSFIICFARIEDMEKAGPILNKHKIEKLTTDGVNGEKNWCGELGADWAGAVIYGVDEILKKHPDDLFVVITDSNEAYYEDDGDDDCDEPTYDYDFSKNEAIDAITKENGFADIEVCEGEGRNG